MRSKIAAALKDARLTKSEGLWTAHCQSIPGVYGIGETRAKATADLTGGLREMFAYLATARRR